MNNENMIESIRNLCKSNNIALTKLEEELGFSQGLISRWKDKAPSLDKIIDIADYFKISLDEVVGRNQNSNDEFLNLLCEKTDDNTIIWLPFDKNTDKSVIKPIICEVYNEDKQVELAYYSTLMNGYISICCHCNINETLNPIELTLNIQPSTKSQIVWQKYYTEDLKLLWIKVLKNLSVKAPDDIRAEDLKNEFINSFKKQEPIKRKNTVIYIPKENIKRRKNVMPVIQVFINEDIDSIKNKGCALLNRKTKNIEVEDLYTDVTDKGKEFYLNNKSIVGKITEARLKNYKDLYLISNTHIMKLSGFGWGKQCGTHGFNGLLEILNDAGFEVNQYTDFDGDDFTLLPPVK